MFRAWIDALFERLAAAVRFLTGRNRPVSKAKQKRSYEDDIYPLF
jgi:hypothetical protein